MKTYPSLGYWKDVKFGQHCIGFDKLDGSNIRFEWSRKRGWYKFGSRTQLINERHPVLGASIPIFFDKYAEGLERALVDNRKILNGANKVMVFCEFLGPQSFAGWHEPSDDKDVTLFDVHVFRRGFVQPRDFIKFFGHLGIPEVLYDGVYDSELVQDVRDGKYGEKTEGLVVKGNTRRNNVWMIKLKTDWWLNEVKSKGNIEEEISYDTLD